MINTEIEKHETYGFDSFLKDVKKHISYTSYNALNEKYNNNILEDTLEWSEICELYDTWKFQLKYAFPNLNISYNTLYEFLTTTDPELFAYRMSVIPAFLRYEKDAGEIINMIFDMAYVSGELKLNSLFEKEIINSAIACCYTENTRYINPFNNNELCIEFNKNYTEEVTDKIYNFFKTHRYHPEGAVVWHICPKYVYENKIKRTGLLPKAKKKNDRNYLSRIYVFLNKPNNNQLKSVATDFNNAMPKDKGWDNNSNDWVLLKIDLKLAGEPIRFFNDPEYIFSGIAAFTYETIHPRCITVDKEFSIN